MANKVKLHLASNSKKRSKLDLSQSHLTTMDFGWIQPVYAKELLPGDSFNVDHSTFIRMAPLAVPTYGRAEFSTQTVFVPYDQVDDYFDGFITGEKSTFGLPSDTGLYTLLVDLCQAFVKRTYAMEIQGTTHTLSSNLVYEVSLSSPDTKYDFSWVENSTGATQKYYRFTTLGRVVYKWLRTLGYEIYPRFAKTANTPVFNTHINLYPLICACKAYYDLFSPSSRANLSLLGALLSQIKSRVHWNSNPDTGFINSDVLCYLLNSIGMLLFDQDYFTSAWAKPGSVLDVDTGLGNTTNMLDEISVYQENGITSKDGVTETTIDNSMVLTQRSLDWLQRFDRYVRRGQYVGQKTLNRLYQMFGVKPKDFKSHYAEIIARSSSPLQIGDVTALADTSDGQFPGRVLGGYAGKGIINDTNKFEYRASDYGHLIVFAWLSVRPMYMDGMDRSVLHTDVLDFYSGDFDDLTANPISKMEIYGNSSDGPIGAQAHLSEVFGFTERYNEYRYGRDQITGDFAKFADMDSWHFGRRFANGKWSYGAQSGVINDYLYPVSRTDSGGKVYMEYENPYDRIFQSEYNSSGASDHFYVTMYFDVNASRPIASISEATGLLTDNDNDIMKNGDYTA